MAKKVGALHSLSSSMSAEISMAKNGDHHVAEDILSRASELILQGKPLEGDLAAWISTGLKKVANGEDAGNVFKLKKPPGTPRKHREEFERLVVESIRSSQAGRHKGLSADGTTRGAYLEAAEEFDIAENTAEKYYQKHIHFIEAEEEIRRDLQDEHHDD
jgi:hypothetical protein